jgi:hypothetical protein
MYPEVLPAAPDATMIKRIKRAQSITIGFGGAFVLLAALTWWLFVLIGRVALHNDIARDALAAIGTSTLIAAFGIAWGVLELYRERRALQTSRRP